jgi:4-amino-4-deoxy-L-arabinose transferase-like glycosyltransferase
LKIPDDHGSESWLIRSAKPIREFITNEKSFALLIAFVLLRLMLIAVTIRFPEGAAIVDSRAYMAFAGYLVDDGTYLDVNSPPGYSFFIALVSGWSTPSFVNTTLAQLVLTSATAILLVPVGQKLISRRAGLMAGWLYALSPNAALWSLTVMTETLYAIILVISLWVWLVATDRSTLKLYAVVGVLLGCGAMVRNIGILVIPVWAVFGFIAYARGKQLLRGLKVAIAITFGAALLILYWSAHNWFAHGRFAFTEETSRTFYVFNIATVLGEVEGISRGEAASILTESQDPAAITMELIRQHPVVFIREQLKGLMRSLFGVATGVWARNFGYPLEMQGSLNLLGNILTGNLHIVSTQLRQIGQQSETMTLLAISLLAFGHTVFQYLLGSGLVFERQGDFLTIVLFLFTAGLLLFSPGAVGQARFRIPVEPYLALLAGVGWENYQIWIAERRRSPLRAKLT